MRISIAQAQEKLLVDEVVAIPTETVYGLAAKLDRPEAIRKIFELKGRSLKNPLIIHVSDVSDVLSYAMNLPPHFQALTEAFWPGPLTLIIPIKTDLIPSIVRANLPTAGFRMPNHSLALKVIQTVGPLVMPSANLSGKPSSTQMEHIEKDFGLDFPVLDGGACQAGLESTILHYQNSRWTIIRLGALSADVFEPILGYKPAYQKNVKDNEVICPGQLFRHYAPQAKLILGNLERIHEADFILGFKERVYPLKKRLLYLGSLDHPHEVAENLYAILRQLDLEGAKVAWIDTNFPETGLWQTIAERLSRAAEI
jgi:L-threonylcarbamoyladenylate synthase